MENSVPAREKIPTRHHPEGIDPDQMFFNETRVHDLILSYQRDGNPETLPSHCDGVFAAHR